MYNDDELNISNDMRKRAFAFMDEIAEGLGYDQVSLYQEAKKIYTRIMDMDELFSLSIKKCSTQDYRRFMRWLLHIYYEYNLYSDFPITVFFVDDIENMIVSAIKHKRCCITGAVSAVHIHHVDRVGMGRNRYHTDHGRYRRMPLRADLHYECHTMGQDEFNEKYHVVGVYCKYWNNSHDKIDDAHGIMTDELKKEIESVKQIDI